MFLTFFYTLRQQGIRASLHEYLTLMEALQKRIIGYSVDEFYALTKAIFVKMETQLDRFDKVFGHYFQGIEELPDDFFTQQIPADWLKKTLMNELSEEEKAAIEKMGGLDALMERFRELMEEQKEEHHGGNKWIGTGGTSPFGHSGHHPEGFRIGGEGKNKSAIKVWEQRAFKNLDDNLELNTRQLKMILKRLRILTRSGLATEFDLDGTIRRTSQNAGHLDIQWQPPKKNRVKVLMLMDVGGSMDGFITLCEQLFSAARHEFKYLEFYYFHNCVYESVWKDNRRRFSERIPTLELMRKYGRDYKLIFVGDATMSPYELWYGGGSVEHYNDEAGMTWLRRLKGHFKDMAWINPTPEYEWAFYETIHMVRQFTDDRMFPMTMAGLTRAMQCLKNNKQTYENKVWDL
ncbi:MAG: VWA domain-containing protein [Bacteroidota bacterium]